MRLEGKVAIITGAASGIGKATALLFGREGARVTCADINGEGAAQVVREIEKAGGQAASEHVDVSQDADVRSMVKETVQRWGRLDVLFNNAGVEAAALVTEMAEDEWDTQMNVNLKSVYLGCKYAIPEMLKGGGGSIVNTASIAGLWGFPQLSAYCAAKGGVVLLTRALAMEWAKENVRVNTVCPGVIRTPMVERAIPWTQDLTTTTMEEAWVRVGQAQPIGRVGEPEEVAEAVLFLASNEASLITGVTVPLDGGWYAGAPLPGSS